MAPVLNNYYSCDAPSLSLINEFNKKYLSNNLTANRLLALTKIIIDSGSTGHYFSSKLLPLMTNVTPYLKFSIRLPDGSRIMSSHIGYFHIEGLPEPACKTYCVTFLSGTILHDRS